MRRSYDPRSEALQRVAGKSPVKAWLKSALDTSLFRKEAKEVVVSSLDLDNIPEPEHGRIWFCGSAPLLPISEHSISHSGMSTLLAHALLVIIMTDGSIDKLDAFVRRSLRESTHAYRVFELAGVMADDDDDLIVILDAIVRLRHIIPDDSPLAPMPLLKTFFQLGRWDPQCLMMLCHHSESHPFAGATFCVRFYEWLTLERDRWQAALEKWTFYYIDEGRWDVRNFDEEEELEDTEENEEKQDEEDESFEISGDASTEEPALSPEEEEAMRERAPFFIKVLVKVGLMYETRQFLLPSTEDEMKRVDKNYLKNEVTSSYNDLLQMTYAFKRQLESELKRREAYILRRPYKEILYQINQFLEVNQSSSDSD